MHEAIPSNSRDSLSRRIGAIAPLVLASTALSAGLSYYMGWRYERAYLHEWGIPFEPGRYSPYELMVVSATTLVLAVSASVSFGLGWWTGPDSPFQVFRSGERPTAGEARAYRVLFGAVVAAAIAAAILSYVRGEYRFYLTIVWLFILVWAFITLRQRSAVDSDERRARADAYLVVVGVIALGFLVIYAPPLLGSADARDAKNHLSDLPKAEFFLSERTGTNRDRGECGGIRSGPWRVVRVNGNRYWVTPDGERGRVVVEIGASKVISIVYGDTDTAAVACLTPSAP